MAYKYNGVTPTNNTLWNTDETEQIAYAEQVKDAAIEWDTIDPNQAHEGDPAKYKLPALFMGTAFRDKPQFQTLLNEFFLKHYVEFHNFLEEEDLDDSTINTWKELEEFLIGVQDSQAYTLLSMLEYLEDQAGHLYVEMDESVPGLLVATKEASAISMQGSHIDDETGVIKMVYSIG